jgi:iron(III) transport system substrate-binding protein
MRTIRLTRLLALVGACSLLLVACGGSPTSSGGGAAADAGSKYADLAKLPIDQLAQKAKEEGSLSLYTSMTEDIAKDVAKAFQQRYGVKVSLYRANSETVLQRVLQEQKAGFRNGNDVVETNALEMNNIATEGHLAPYTRDPRKAVDAGGLFPAWTATRFNLFAPSWNTNLVKEGEQPKTWEDLADPKWKGKLSMEVSDYDWFVTLWKYWTSHGKTEQQAERLFRSMAANAKVVKGHTVQSELLSAGQFAVTAAQYTYIAQKAADKGAPVGYKPVVLPVIARPNGFGLMKTARHPAAALLFADWILTEGQDLLVKESITPSVKGKDTATEDVERIPVDLKTLAAENKQWSDRYDQILSAGEKVKESEG